MHVRGDIVRSKDVIPDTDSPTVRDGNVLPADAISRRSSKLVLGKEVHADNYIDKRIKWAQRGIGASSCLTLLYSWSTCQQQLFVYPYDCF